MKDDNETGSFVARASYVFNVEQVDGWQPPMQKPWSEVEINEEIAAFVQATGADVRHGWPSGSRIAMTLDCIEMPDPRTLQKHRHQFCRRRRITRSCSMRFVIG